MAIEIAHRITVDPAVMVGKPVIKGTRVPVELSIGGVDLRMRSGCTDWVVYDIPAHATCVEPQSAPPDAFNIRPHRLEPGEGLEIWFDITVTT